MLLSCNEFTFKFINKHVVVYDNFGVSYLIDTGSPWTIINERTMKEFNLGFSHEPCCVPKISHNQSLFDNVARWVPDTTIDYLVGLDFFKLENTLQLYPTTGKALILDHPDFSKDDVSLPMTVNALSGYMIKLEINGKLGNFIMDTGAQINYINSKFTDISSYKTSNIFNDYNPIFGHFETSIYNIPTNIDGNILNMQYGLLPSQYEDLIGADGIIGYELISKCKKFIFVINDSSGSKPPVLYITI